jgi:hypothetical protein
MFSPVRFSCEKGNDVGVLNKDFPRSFSVLSRRHFEKDKDRRVRTGRFACLTLRNKGYAITLDIEGLSYLIFFS